MQKEQQKQEIVWKRKILNAVITMEVQSDGRKRNGMVNSFTERKSETNYERGNPHTHF
jgi:hypothetical protein